MDSVTIHPNKETMTDDKLKEVIELFARALENIADAVTCDEQNKSRAHIHVKYARRNLHEIIEIVNE